MTDEKEEKNVIAKEIESWNSFEYSLREEDRILFNKMLNECQQEQQYINAANAKGETYVAESLLIALIFQQQKMIGHYVDKLLKHNKEIKGCC
jgi:hypothetical protein